MVNFFMQAPKTDLCVNLVKTSCRSKPIAITSRPYRHSLPPPPTHKPSAGTYPPRRLAASRICRGDHAHAVEEVHLAFEAGGDHEAVVAELDVLDARVLHGLAHVDLGDLHAVLFALHDVGVLDLDAGRHVVDDEAVGVAALVFTFRRTIRVSPTFSALSPKALPSAVYHSRLMSKASPRGGGLAGLPA